MVADARNTRRRPLQVRTRTRPSAHTPQTRSNNPEHDPQVVADLEGDPQDRALSNDIRYRIRQIYALDGKAAAIEFCRRQVYEMTLAGMPDDLIAQKLGVSTRTVENYRRDLRRRVVQRVKTLNPDEILGGILEHFNHQIQVAWRDVMTATSKVDRRQSQALALKAQGEMVRFLQSWGFMHHHSYVPRVMEDDHGADRGRAGDLVSAIEDVLGSAGTALAGEADDAIEFTEEE